MSEHLTLLNDWQGQLMLLVQIIVAMALSAAVGVERERAHKPAGFRTLVLIAGSTAFLVGLARAMTGDFNSIFPSGVAQADPVRVIQSIVTAVGFLGAGTIFRHKDRDGVEGLTTAATVLLAATLGIACALNQFVVAVGVTVLALVVLRITALMEYRRARKKKTSHKKKPTL